MTDRSRFLIVLSFGLVFTALISQNGTIALMAIPLLVYLTAGVLKFPDNVHLLAERTLSTAVNAEVGTVVMGLKITNSGGPIDFLRVIDPLPAPLVSSDHFSGHLFALAAGEHTTLNSEIQAKRGYYRWENLKIVASDPLGLFEKIVETTAESHLLVRPQINRLQHIPIRPLSTLHSTGMVPARLAGSGTDFWNIRPYQSGDSLRYINWQKTARHPGHFFTKQFEQEEIMDIALILDTRFPPETCAGTDNLFEKSVAASAALAEVFLREGNRVGLLVFGQQMRHLFPGYGKHQLNSILRTLSLVTPGPQIGLSNIEFLLKRIFQSRTQVIMVSPLMKDDIWAYTRMRAFGYPIFLISPDTVDFSFQSFYKEACQDELAMRAARIERLQKLMSLQRLGIQIVDWPVSQTLNDVLHTTIRKNGHAQIFKELR